MSVVFHTDDALSTWENDRWRVSMVVEVDGRLYRMGAEIKNNGEDPLAAALEDIARQCERAFGEST
jgi:hypothetical protein